MGNHCAFAASSCINYTRITKINHDILLDNLLIIRK